MLPDCEKGAMLQQLKNRQEVSSAPQLELFDADAARLCLQEKKEVLPGNVHWQRGYKHTAAANRRSAVRCRWSYSMQTQRGCACKGRG